MNRVIIDRDTVVLIGVITWSVLRLIYLINNDAEKIDIKREVIINCFAYYIIMLIAGVFFPIILQFGENITKVGPLIRFRPMNSLYTFYRDSGAKEVIKDITINVVLLTPLIIFLRLLWGEKCNTIQKALICACIVSISIESIQAVESILIAGTRRTTDINDVIFNTISGAIGFVLYDIITNFKYGKLDSVISKVYNFIKR